jgi:hypothetical protein
MKTSPEPCPSSALVVESKHCAAAAIVLSTLRIVLMINQLRTADSPDIQVMVNFIL